MTPEEHTAAIRSLQAEVSEINSVRNYLSARGR